MSGAAVVSLLIVTALVATYAGYTVKRRAAPEPDDAPMPMVKSRLLALYLLGWAIAAIYVAVKLFSVEFATPQTHRAAPAFDQQRPAEEKKPIILRVDPPVAVLGVQPELRVYGYHFTRDAKVHFDEEERPTTYLGEHLLLVPLLPADQVKVESAMITVRSPAGTSDASRVQSVPDKGELSLLKRVFPLSREVHLLLLVLVAGGLGSYVHSIRSLADYIGNRKLLASWFWFYFTKPFIGMAVALMFYAAIRGGFVAGSPADVKSVNPFGVFAIAAMVGMFVDKAGDKLADIFDALFKARDERTDKLTELGIETKGPLEAKVNTPFTQQLKATGGKKPYTWTQKGLPAGLALDAATGVVAGTPTAEGDATVIVTVKDAARATDTETINLTVKP